MKVEVCFFCVLSYLDLIIKFGKVFVIIEVLVYDVFNVKCDEVEIVCKFILDELVEIVEIFLDSYNGSYLYEIGCIICVGVLVFCVCVVLYFGNYVEVEVLVGKIIFEGYYFLFCVLLFIIVQ